MQNYVLAMFVQMNYFIVKIIFHNFISYRASQPKKNDGTDQRKTTLLQMYAWRQISNYIHQSDEQFIAANFSRKNNAALMMHTISHTHHIVHRF